MKRLYELFFMSLILFSFSLSYAKEGKKVKQIREISADYLCVKGETNTFFKECIGAGRAYEGLRAAWQQQLLETKKECDFKRIRFHAVFHDEMGIYHEDADGIHFNWQYVDALYDYLVNIGVKPFVELAFMPNDLRSGEQTIFWWKGNVTPPKDYDKWELLVESFAKHLKERYGEKEVASWFFEVWNEPNLNENGFFTGTQEDYFKLYKYSAQGIKAASPLFKVGGPATAGCAWIPELINYCKKNDVPLDFITTHHYGVDGYLDEKGVYQLRMPGNADGLPSTIGRTVQSVKESCFPDLQVHFTEWSSSYSPRDPVHDTYQNATIILNALRKVNPAPASMSYWTFTDIFEEPGTVNTPFHGGFGLMNFQGIKKPTYFAFKFLNELGKKELATNDSDSWVCTNEDGDVQALFWNLTMLNQNNEPNQIFYKKNLPPVGTHTVHLSLKDLPNGKYIKEIYRVGYKINDAYTAYYDMGSPSQLSNRQVDALKNLTKCFPTDQNIVTIENGKYEDMFQLRDNDIFFVKLKRVL